MKYTAEEVRAIAKRLHDDITVADGDALMASDMLTAYADLLERIKADEGAAPVAVTVEQIARGGGVAFTAADWVALGNLPAGTELFTHPPAQAEQSCEKCKGRGEAFNDVHVRMMTCPHCHGAGKVAPAEPAMQDDWRIGFFERWREAAHEKGYAGVAEAIMAAPPDFLRVTTPAPAPSIDLAAVREVIAHLRSFRSNTPPTWAHLDDAADKLEAAIKGVE